MPAESATPAPATESTIYSPSAFAKGPDPVTTTPAAETKPHEPVKEKL